MKTSELAAREDSSTFLSLLQELAALSGVPRPTVVEPVKEAGATLAGGRFTVHRVLGRGGMGVVYEALDADHDALVALKTLPVVEPELLVRFRREFRALSQVAHPNLVRPVELFGEGTDWFFTMEFVNGVDLESYVGTDLERFRRTLLQLADALHALHQAGLVHRDVKPSNILVTSEGRLALIDLGLVRDLFNPSWLDQDSVGTRAFMAPEVQAGESVDAAADWYAVGVIIRRFLRRSITLPAADAAPLARLSDSLMHPDLKRRAGYEQVAASVGRHRSTPSPAGSALSIAASQEVAISGLIGRAAILGQLHAEAERVASLRQLRCVYLQGMSGIGKSTVIGHFAAGQPSFLVLHGRCFEQESVSYKGLDGVVEAIATHLASRPEPLGSLSQAQTSLLARAFPVLAALPGIRRDSKGAAGTRLLAAALRALLQELCREKPVAIIIDDFQWVDADAMNLLQALLSEADGMPLLVLLASRPAELPKLGIPLNVVELGPLDVDEARRYAQVLVRGLAEVDVEALVTESEGHPLHLAELVRHAATAGGIVRHLRLDEALVERAKNLDPNARLLLSLVNLAPAPVRREVLARASGLDGSDFLANMDLLRRQGWTVSSGSSGRDLVNIFHDRGREALRQSLSAQRAAELHRQFADAYEQLEPAAHERLAFHFHAAGSGSKACEHALAAARDAEQTLAYDRAVQHYQTVLTLQDDPDGSISERLAHACVAANRPLDAAAAFRSASQRHVDSPKRRALLAQAAAHLLSGGEVGEGLAQLYEVLDSLGLPAARTKRQAIRGFVFARLTKRLHDRGWLRTRTIESNPELLERIDLLHTASTALLLVDGLRGQTLRIRNLLLARRSGDAFRIARALAMDSCAESTSGTVERAQRAAEEAAQLSASLDPAQKTYLNRSARALAAFRQGDWQQMIARYDEGVVDREELRGTPWEIASALLYSQFARLQAGELSEWRRHAELGRSEALRRRDKNLALCSDVAGVLVPLLDDDFAKAIAAQESIEDRLWEGVGFLRILAHLARVWLHLYDADVSSAGQVILGANKGLDFASRQIHYTGSWLRYLECSAELCRSDRRPTRKLCRRIEKNAVLLETGVPWTKPMALVLRSRLAELQADTLRARRLLDQAVELSDSGGHYLFAGAAAVARAVWYERGSAQPDQLRKYLDVADPIRFAGMFMPGLTRDC